MNLAVDKSNLMFDFYFFFCFFVDVFANQDVFAKDDVFFSLLGIHLIFPSLLYRDF